MPLVVRPLLTALDQAQSYRNQLIPNSFFALPLLAATRQASYPWGHQRPPVRLPLSFYKELKRRNVYRVGTAYVVTAWLIIQVVETIFRAFGFGNAAVRTVVNLIKGQHSGDGNVYDAVHSGVCFSNHDRIG